MSLERKPSRAETGSSLDGFFYTLGLTLGIPVIATSDSRTVAIGATVTAIFIGFPAWRDWRAVRRDRAKPQL